MTAVTRWKVRRSVKYPGRWLAYGMYGDRIVRGSGVTFRTWQAATNYVDSKVRWAKIYGRQRK